MSNYKIGDVLKNPYVSEYVDGKVYPLYAMIYLGNNKLRDYNGNIHSMKPPVEEDSWEVLGHIDCV